MTQVAKLTGHNTRVLYLVSYENFDSSYGIINNDEARRRITL